MSGDVHANGAYVNDTQTEHTQPEDVHSNTQTDGVNKKDSWDDTIAKIHNLILLLKLHPYTDLGLLFHQKDEIVDENGISLGIGYNIFIQVLMGLKKQYKKWFRECDLHKDSKNDSCDTCTDTHLSRSVMTWHPPSTKLECKICQKECSETKSSIDNGTETIKSSLHSNYHQVHMEGDAFWISRLWLLLYGDDDFQWNFRRRMFMRFFFSKIQSNVDTLEYQLVAQNELWFVELALSKHVKSEEAWQYRRWFLAQMNQFNLAINWEYELQIAERGYVRYARNYYAWNYRYYIIDSWINLFVRHLKEESIVKKELKQVQNTISIDILEYMLNNQDEKDTRSTICSIFWNEIAHIQQYLRRNISDHSAINHGMRILKCLHGTIQDLMHDATLSMGNLNNVQWMVMLMRIIKDTKTRNEQKTSNVTMESNAQKMPNKNLQEISQWQDKHLAFSQVDLTLQGLIITLLQGFYNFYFLNQYMLVYFPGHETLWLQRRAILHFYLFEILPFQLHFDILSHFETASKSRIESKYKIDAHYKYLPISLQSELEFIQHTASDQQLDNYTKHMIYATKCCLWVCKTMATELSQSQIVNFVLRFISIPSRAKNDINLLRLNAKRYLEVVVSNFQDVDPRFKLTTFQ